MTYTFVASRLSKGNRFIPNKLVINDDKFRGNISFIVPGLFGSGHTTTIPLHKISSYDTQTPLIGFSKVEIEAAGVGKITANGFTKNNVLRIKELLLQISE